jgi:hypothetical protein
MSDGIGMAEELLGLSGFRVLDVVEHDAEVVIRVETTATRAFCRSCGVRAEPHRMRVGGRDLACFGRPARLARRLLLPGQRATNRPPSRPRLDRRARAQPDED